MVKKFWIVFGVIIIVVLTAVISIQLFPKHYEAIAITEDLYFGMSPFEVRLKYGKPDEMHESKVSPEKTYIYYINIDGSPAKLNISFIQATMMYKLYRVDIRIDTNEVGIQKTYNSILEKIRNAYLCSTSLYEEGDANTVNLINNNGATSLTCKIWIEESSVYITAIKTW